MENNETKYKRLIILLSIVIPLAVAMLFTVKVDGYDLTFLPPIYASLNGLTAIVLILAVVAIKKGNKLIHGRLMKTCLLLSATFLVMYIAYHMTSESTSYGGVGAIRYVYFFILITHIILSIAIIPMVLFTYVRALSEQFDKHKKLARITFPIWLYVAITGVIVYSMISPYYS